MRTQTSTAKNIVLITPRIVSEPFMCKEGIANRQ